MSANLRTGATAAVAVLALAAAGCASSHGQKNKTTAAQASAITVNLTSDGCAPKPATIKAGEVQFNVANTGAGGVSEAELRTSDLSHILGEQENLTPGLSGGFALNIQPGRYQISCPGAKQPHWAFTVTGKATGPAWQSNPQLTAAVTGYGKYVGQNAATLVGKTQRFCAALDAGDETKAERLYPAARTYYERIEPVAEIWGSLDTAIDGRWENPVTKLSEFTGFHRIEQLLWEDDTLKGTGHLCDGLVKNEKQLLRLVQQAKYNPLEMASGATDLVNEAATSKISGEEERYSSTDLPDFEANIDGAMEVVRLLQPYLQRAAPSLVPEIQQRHAAVTKLLAKYHATPGYDNTGFVEYSTVLNSQRRQLATSVNALAEAMSKISSQVS